MINSPRKNASLLVMLAMALATVGAALAQDPATATKGAPAAKAKRKGGLLAPGGPRAKALRKEAADPFAKPADADADADAKKAAAAAAATGAFHYGFKIQAIDGSPLAATFYPSRLGTGAAVILLVHERDRSSKDFEDKVAELGNIGLAEGLQKKGFAVLSFDLRGHGANPRRGLSARDWKMMVADLQSAYLFLIDRHNRGELNLSRLGVVAVGEGANLALTWANLPGGGVSSQGRAGDVGGLVLVSPMVDAQSQGLRAQQPMTALAARVPLCVLAGEKDAASADLVKAAKAAVTRVRSNKVELYPSSLHGFKLLRLEPSVTGTVIRFFEDTIKAKAEEWEPRYNLEPVAYSEVKLIPNPAPKADAPSPAPDAPKAKEAEALKAKDAP